MNKIIIIVTLIFLGIISLMMWGKSTQNKIEPNTGAISNLDFSEKLYDFGTISMKNGLVAKDFTVTNNTDKDIVIPSLVTSCMCTKAYFVKPDGNIKGPFGMPSMGFVPPLNETIKVGESRIVRAVYDPNAHGPAGVGPIDRFLILTDAAGGKLQLEIKAMVTP